MRVFRTLKLLAKATLTLGKMVMAHPTCQVSQIPLKALMLKLVTQAIWDPHSHWRFSMLFLGSDLLSIKSTLQIKKMLRQVFFQPT